MLRVRAVGADDILVMMVMVLRVAVWGFVMVLSGMQAKASC